MTITIPVNDRRAGPFTAAAGQTTFDFDFPILSTGSLFVTRERGGAMSSFSYPADYAVTGVGNQTGGAIILAAAAEAGDVITILGDEPVERSSDYTLNGPLSSKALNADLDRTIIMLQELRRDHAAQGATVGALDDVIAAAQAAAEAARDAAASAQALAEDASDTAGTSSSAAASAAAAATDTLAATQQVLATAQQVLADAETARDAAAAASQSIGFGYRWATGAVSVARMRGDAAALANASSLMLSTISLEGDVADAIATWDDADAAVRGTLTLRCPQHADRRAELVITGDVAIASGIATVPIEIADTGAAFQDGDLVVASFARSGDDGAGAVESFRGRTGAIVPADGDYTASLVTNSAERVPGASVAEALDYLHSPHPLDIDVQELFNAPGMHRWHGPIVYDATRRRHWLFFGEGYKHGHSPAGMLRVAWSEDGFSSAPEIIDIHADAALQYSPQFAAATVYPNGRVALAIYVYDATGNHGVKWITTDDGAAWSHTDVSLTAPIVLGGEFHEMADGSRVAYGYGGTPTEPSYFRVVGGDTGSPAFYSATCCPAPPVGGMSEPRVVRLNDTQWLMYGRDDRSTEATPYNARVAWSTDGLAFSAPNDSHLPLGSNPLAVIKRGRRFYFYALSRGDFLSGPGDADRAGGYGSALGHLDRLLVHDVDIDVHWAQAGIFQPGNRTWRVARDLPRRATGQIHWCTDDAGRFWANASVGEILIENGDPAAEQSIVLFTPNRAITTATARQSSVNLLDNPTFDRRDYGVNAALADGFFAPRWQWRGNGAAANVQMPIVPAATARLLPFGQHEAVSISSSGAAFSAIEQVTPGAAYMQQVSEQTATLQLWASGFVPSVMTLQIVFDFDNGQPPVSKSYVMPGTPGGFGLTCFRVRFLFPSAAGVSLGAVPKVTFSLKAGGTGSLGWGLTLYRAHVALGAEYPELEPVDRVAHALMLDRYRERIDLAQHHELGIASIPSNGNGQFGLAWGPKVATPAVTFAGGYQSGDLGLGGYAVTAISAAYRRERAATLLLTATGVTTGYAQPVRATRDIALIIDTGF